MLKIKCAHCSEIQEREYGEVFPDLRNNHFHKLMCSKCGKRTMLHYQYTTEAINDTAKHQNTDQILSAKDFLA